MSQTLILVVDDDDDTRAYLSALLSKLGYGVNTAASAEEAETRLTNGGPAPALILLDLVLPGTHGLDLLDRLKQIRPEVPTVILSALGQIKTVVEAVEPRRHRLPHQALPGARARAGHRERAREAAAAGRGAGAAPAAGPVHGAGRLPRPPTRACCASARSPSRWRTPTLPCCILGESGVGKEVLARFVHAQSPRRDKPLVQGQLRGAAQRAAGVRAVRLRAGRLLRRDARQARPVRAGRPAARSCWTRSAR